ncbi:hypothetical protein Rhopal_001853-T1 [Rhodotorula paludigena]|uniref:MYND-type domain-containing protein n=1 Tax=Rhodotorula paludigena TaxID=86838 RepID=A0AAV5GIJ3_9BASI|nr:hypothetical protein Rhopal_001853-T1 [Rhodotorula paludigena]
MATQEIGECMICGIESAKCCSGCKKHGTRIFFCSNEHQNLMWVLHRKFCGPKLHPFRLSPLTQTEAAKAWTNRHMAITDVDGQRTDLIEVAPNFSGLTEDELENFSPGSEPEKQQDRLNLVRNMLTLLRQKAGVINEPSPVPPTLFALGMLNTIIVTHFGVTLSRHENQSWFTPLMHRFCAITVILLEPPSSTFSALTLRIAAFVEHAIVPTDPMLGMLTLQRLVPFVTNERQRRLMLGMDTV